MGPPVRSEFYPPAKGNQWTNGAIGCPEWTGVRLADVLEDCGIGKNAVYVAYEAADSHLSGDQTKQAISRGVPVHKALENKSLLVWAMNEGCHSHALVTSQRADRQTWLDIIRWMQATQNLWKFTPEIEAQILDYLATGYAPQLNRRRPPIPPGLMPAAESAD